MRTLTNSLFVAGIALLLSCNKEQTEHIEQESIAVITVDDYSEPHALQTNATSVISLFDFEHHKNQSVLYRHTAITDLALSPSFELTLQNSIETDKKNKYDDPQHRSKTVRGFYTELTQELQAFDSMYRNDARLINSECFRTIARELTILQETKCKKKILVVYSDLLELSGIYSAYIHNSTGIAKRYVRVIDKFEQRKLLPDSLHAVQVYFIYRAPDRESSLKHLVLVEKVYKPILTKRGATVYVQSSSEIQNHRVR